MCSAYSFLPVCPEVSMLSKGLLAVGLLCVSNIFMTCAWYLHLKLQTMKVINFSSWPIYTVVDFYWGLAIF